MGVITFGNGDCYTGEFQDDYFNGYGIYKWKDGTSLIG